jgi:hypothetical protein
MRHTSTAGFIYLIIGLIVAGSHGYFVGLTSVGNILSALLAIIAWPLLFVGINLHLAL